MPKVKSKRRYVRDLDSIKATLARLERKIDRSSSSSSCSSDSESTETDSSEKSAPREELEGHASAPLPVIPTEPASTPGKDILELLGEHPGTPNSLGPDLHEELAVRWSIYLKDGLKADNRKELIQKYLIPANCKTFSAPKINEEIKPIMPTQVSRNDYFFCSLQDQIGATLSALGSIISEKLTEPEKELSISNEVMEKMINASQLITSVHHAISLKRKFEINPFMNEESRAASNSNPIDEFLFGSDFLTKVKERREVKKAGTEIRKIVKTTALVSESPGKNFLNSRRPYQKHKMKGEKKGQQFRVYPPGREATRGRNKRSREMSRTRHSYRKGYYK